MFLSVSRNRFKTVSNYTKTFICKILYKIRKQIISNKYATNLKTRISQRSLGNSSLLLLLFEYNNFSFLIDKIDYYLSVRNILPELQPMVVRYYCNMSTSVSRDQYTALPLEGVLVTGYERKSNIYTFWNNFYTVLCQFLETGTSDRCLIGRVQLLRFSGFSLYPL